MDSDILRASERLANAVEDILHTEYTLEDWEELRNAWQAYVDIAPEEEPATGNGGDTDTSST